ncbi:hypothetical protein P8935_06240 [Telmatobacter sp. DSM 110680]|uniref:Uncharacterized protein n=1 Tax=Telmatobacter sp. DSM 110680 TaxID=3036704 RepID=A0AAU7DNN8_9BACT
MSRSSLQSSKWTSRFYLCCAAILFALGVWLLIAPAKARGQSLSDNGFALEAGNPSCVMAMTMAGESSDR